MQMYFNRFESAMICYPRFSWVYKLQTKFWQGKSPTSISKILVSTLPKTSAMEGQSANPDSKQEKLTILWWFIWHNIVDGIKSIAYYFCISPEKYNLIYCGTLRHLKTLGIINCSWTENTRIYHGFEVQITNSVPSHMFGITRLSSLHYVCHHKASWKKTVPE